jgi:hypothetical protein
VQEVRPASTGFTGAKVGINFEFWIWNFEIVFVEREAVGAGRFTMNTILKI